jgi:hypothetical protein
VTEIGNGPKPPGSSANHASTSPMAYQQQMDVVSGEQYRYALTNFVSRSVARPRLLHANHRDPTTTTSASPTKKSKNSAVSSKNKKNKSPSSVRASRSSRGPPPTRRPKHSPSRAVTRWTISRSRCVFRSSLDARTRWQGRGMTAVTNRMQRPNSSGS